MSLLIFCLILFLIGISGFFITRKNLLLLLIFIELTLLAINTFLVVISVYHNDLLGELFALFILNIAAAESSIGLALVLAYFRVVRSVSIDYLHLLKG